MFHSFKHFDRPVSLTQVLRNTECQLFQIKQLKTRNPEIIFKFIMCMANKQARYAYCYDTVKCGLDCLLDSWHQKLSNGHLHWKAVLEIWLRSMPTTMVLPFLSGEFNDAISHLLQIVCRNIKYFLRNILNTWINIEDLTNFY